MIQRILVPGALPSIFPYKSSSDVKRPGAVKRNRRRAISEVEEQIANEKQPCPSGINEEGPLTRAVATQTEPVLTSNVATQACIIPKRKQSKIQVDCSPK